MIQCQRKCASQIQPWSTAVARIYGRVQPKRADSTAISTELSRSYDRFGARTLSPPATRRDHMCMSHFPVQLCSRRDRPMQLASGAPSSPAIRDAVHIVRPRGRRPAAQSSSRRWGRRPTTRLPTAIPPGPPVRTERISRRPRRWLGRCPPRGRADRTCKPEKRRRSPWPVPAR